MHENLMLLPAKDPRDMRILRIPDDFEAHEVYRYVTGLIAKAEEQSDYEWDDILEILEQRGFESVDFIFGPSLD